MKTTFALLVSGALAPAAFAQSFNIDIGQPAAGPPSSYAAAGQPGHWMSIPATQSVMVFNLVDINGQVTAARMNQIGGTETLLVDDPDLSGDDATLMNDFIITHTAIENCLFFSDMEPGEYEVLVYARMPAQPDVLCLTSCDQEPGIPHLLVGGGWPGHHEEGISYSVHSGTVVDFGPSVGKLNLHSGVSPGGSFAIGAALNGVQIRKIEPNAPDLNGDRAVNAADLALLLGAWGACTPNCPAADLNEDGAVNAADLALLLGAWG